MLNSLRIFTVIALKSATLLEMSEYDFSNSEERERSLKIKQGLVELLGLIVLLRLLGLAARGYRAYKCVIGGYGW